LLSLASAVAACGDTIEDAQRSADRAQLEAETAKRRAEAATRRAERAQHEAEVAKRRASEEAKRREALEASQSREHGVVEEVEHLFAGEEEQHNG